MSFSNTNTAMRRLGQLLVSKYKERVVEDNTVATGGLRDSFVYRVKDNGATIDLEVLASKVAEVIDTGRGKGELPPPYSSIIRWMNAKGITPKKGTTARDYKAASIAIAKSIGANGTIKRFGNTGTNFIKEVARQYEGEGIVEILEAYGRDIETQVNKVTKQ